MIPLSDNIYIAANKPQDDKYGPYVSLAEARSKVPVTDRYKGLTIGLIEVDGSITEYWWKKELADDGLVIKSAGVSTLNRTTLLEMQANLQLIQGATYVFTYYPSYTIAGSTVTEPTGETFLIQALAKDRLSKEVKSVQYPQDVITYDIAADKVEYRKDSIKNIAFYLDWRFIKNRRYKVTGIYHHATALTADTFSTTIVYGTVDAVPNRYREYFVDFGGIDHPANPKLTCKKGSATVTRELVKFNGAAFAANELKTYLTNGKAVVYYSVSMDKYVAYNNGLFDSLVQGYYSYKTTDFTIGNGTRLKVDANDYQDLLTLGSNDPACRNIYVGKESSNIVFTGSIDTTTDIHIDSIVNSTLSFVNDSRVLRMGIGCSDLLLIGQIRYMELSTNFKNSLFVSNAYLSLYIENREGYAENNSVFSNTVMYEIKTKMLANSTLRIVDVPSWSYQYVDFGYVVSTFVNTRNSTFLSEFDCLVNKSFEFSCTYGGTRMLGYDKIGHGASAPYKNFALPLERVPYMYNPDSTNFETVSLIDDGIAY